jgi:hypothetical protein
MSRRKRHPMIPELSDPLGQDLLEHPSSIIPQDAERLGCAHDAQSTAEARPSLAYA